MRPETRWMLAAAAALVVGAIGARTYARLAAPYYQAVAQLIAEGRPWQIVNVEVASSPSSPGAILRLTGFVREFYGDAQPAARLVGKLQVAAVVESPVIFWTLLLLWPAYSYKQRFARLALGIPVFLSLEAATTVCQLLNPFGYASAVLAGERDPLTLWDRWSRFLEAGGRIAIALAAALMTIAVIQLLGRSGGSLPASYNEM